MYSFPQVLYPCSLSCSKCFYMKKKNPPGDKPKVTRKADPGSPVIRLRIQIDGDNWKVLKQMRIEKMTLPKQPALPDDKGKGYAGFWAELVDDKNKMLYRVFKKNPLTTSREVIGEKGKLSANAGTTKPVILDLLVPEVKGMNKLRFFSDTSPATDEKAFAKPGTARVIKEISLKES